MTSTNDLIDLFDAEERAAPDPAARALRRRRVRRTLIIVTVVVLVIAASIAGYVTWALHAPLPAPTASSRTLEGTAGAPVSIDRPGEGATAALVIGAPDYLGADGLRLTAGPDEPQPIASLSKIITALVVLDAHPLADAADPGPTITFGKADHDLYDAYYVQDAAVAEMPTGSSMSLHDALATMLIPSASNYADAVSTWAFGSRGAFLAATRDFLSREGLSGTTIVEPTGLSIVGATLGGTTREAQDAAVLRLLGSIRGGFHTVALVEAGMVVGSYKTAWGGSAQLVVADAAAIRTWSDTPIAVSTELTNPTEYRDGERVGTVTWTAGAASTTAALRVRGAIEPPTDWWRLSHPDPLGR